MPEGRAEVANWVEVAWLGPVNILLSGSRGGAVGCGGIAGLEGIPGAMGSSGAMGILGLEGSLARNGSPAAQGISWGNFLFAGLMLAQIEFQDSIGKVLLFTSAAKRNGTGTTSITAPGGHKFSVLFD